MMPEEWPIAALAVERGASLRRHGRGRLETVRRDFFLHDSERLSEQERALMAAMLDCLVCEVAEELRASLPSGWAAANDGSNDKLIARLKAAQLLDIEPLIAIMLRRAEEECALAAAKGRPNRRDAKLLNSLVSHDNGPVAAAAMSLVLARGKRRDSLGKCLVTTDDLDAQTLDMLAQRVAAVLRSEFAAAHGSALSDEALGKAVDGLLRRHNPDASTESLTREVVALLDGAGRLDDSLLIRAAAEGELVMLAHGLARRAGVDPVLALDTLTSGRSDHVMALLRMGGASRELAASLIAGSGDILDFEDSGQAIESFDQLSANDVEAARAWMRSSAGYRAALAKLGQSDG